MLEDAGIDIARHDLPDLRTRSRDGSEHHRDGVGLLACRTAGRPNGRIPRQATLLQELPQDRKVVHLAVEIREVRRQRIDECGELRTGAGFHAIEIFAERRDVELAQPAPETAVDHRPLVVAEMYAGMRQYQPAYAMEIVVRELEIKAYPFGALDTAVLLLWHGTPVVALL